MHNLQHSLHQADKITKMSFSISLARFSDHLLRFKSSSAMAAAISSASSVPSQPKSVRVVIKGRVQGVFFRDWTVQNAQELGLNGWVRNRRDGSVEAVFSGDPDSVMEMIEKRCKVGPPSALVTSINSYNDVGDEELTRGFQRKPTV